MNEVLFEIPRRYRLVGDLPEGDDRIFVVVSVYRDRRTGGDHPGAMRRQKDELKPVFNFVDTIFYGDTGHRLDLLVTKRCRGLKLS